MDENKSRADFYIFGLAGWSGLVWGDLLRFEMIWNDLGQLRWKPGLGSQWDPSRSQKLKILNVNLT